MPPLNFTCPRPPSLLPVRKRITVERKSLYTCNRKGERRRDRMKNHTHNGMKNIIFLLFDVILDWLKCMAYYIFSVCLCNVSVFMLTMMVRTICALTPTESIYRCFLPLYCSFFFVSPAIACVVIVVAVGVPLNIGCFESRSIAKAISCFESNLMSYSICCPLVFIFNCMIQTTSQTDTYTHIRYAYTYAAQCTSHNAITSQSFRAWFTSSWMHGIRFIRVYTTIIELNPYMGFSLTLCVYVCVCWCTCDSYRSIQIFARYMKEQLGSNIHYGAGEIST